MNEESEATAPHEDMNPVQWIEHQTTRVVSVAGFVGGLVAYFTPLIGGDETGVIALGVATVSAALHVANRALDTFAKSAGIVIQSPLSRSK